MKLLARINKCLKFTELRYLEFSPNEYMYNTLRKKSLFVQFNGVVYRIDNIDRDAEITRDIVYSAIDDSNKTWIHKCIPWNLEGELKLMKEGNGSRGIVLGEILKTK